MYIWLRDSTQRRHQPQRHERQHYDDAQANTDDDIACGPVAGEHVEEEDGQPRARWAK